jgi:hypothetical protein
VLAQTNEHRLISRRKGVAAGRLFAADLTAALGFAQFSASWHDASVRHVQCAEHGEAVDVGIIANPGLSPGRHRAHDTGIAGADSAETAAHDHCSVVFAWRAGTRAQLVRLATHFAPPPVVMPSASDFVAQPGRAFVLASAPKTSPPAA